MTQLGEQRFQKRLGICFRSLRFFNLEHTSLSPSTKVSVWFRVRYCCVIRALSSDFNPSSDLQLWIGCVHQSCAAGISLGEELIGLSSLGAGGFILSGLITFKIFHKPSYEWAVVTKTVHQLKFLQLSKFNDHSPTMARVTAIYQKHMTT